MELLDEELVDTNINITNVSVSLDTEFEASD